MTRLTTRWKMTGTRRRGKVGLSDLTVAKVTCFSDAVVNQVLDELGLQLNDQLSGLPQTGGTLQSTGTKQPAAAAAAAGGNGGLSDADADLQARLDNLRRE